MKRTLVLALLALAAVAATSFAYGAIPSSNGVISSCKSKDGSLKLIDKEAGQGCPGSQQLVEWNQQGPAGPTGPAGPSHAYVGVYPTKNIPGVGTASTIGSLPLPAGQYLVFAKGDVLSGGVPSSIQHCTLDGPQGDDSFIAYEYSSAAYVESFSLLVPATFSEGGSATLSCQSWGGATLSNIKLSAIKVGNLTTEVLIP